MAYYKDLSLCGYFDHAPYFHGFKKLYAIGWLDEGKPYNKGKVSKEFIEKLKELYKNPHMRIYYCGWHNCFICNKHMGDDQLFIPGKNKIYVCPKSVDHYIEEHNYCPPKEFIDAVMNTGGMCATDDNYMNKMKKIDERVYLFLITKYGSQELDLPWEKEWDKIKKEENRKINKVLKKKDNTKIRKLFKKSSFEDKVKLLSQYFK